ncbi:MAG: RNA-directed DNA polymerase [Ketobacter sp.]|nr:RNA-directed DNA polymerase [Ketobacter sp.]
MYRKKRIPYKKERVILSDVLPYEVPLTYSNRYLYDFLVENKIEFTEEFITWKSGNVGLDTTVKLLLGISLNKNPEMTSKRIGNTLVPLKRFHKPAKQISTRPFQFLVKHKEDSYRELSICHPIVQLKAIQHYDNYASSILYYSSLSSFSIRRPVRLAKQLVFVDSLQKRRRDLAGVGVEQADNEYKNLRSFFVYEKYNNIYKFYESYEFHRCEKKFNKLLKLDISKCFDSIYSHSISWAVFGRDRVRNQFLGTESRTVDNIFPGVLDTFMQNANGRETNGIIIGPEFSRIFAELILQAVDCNLERVLLERYSIGLHGQDYKIFRYIDDYFIFYNTDDVKEAVLAELQRELKVYKLHLSPEKAKIYEKPIITEITIAKERISTLMDDLISFRNDHSDDSNGRIRIAFESNKAITRLKLIIKESEVTYRDIQNWVLAVLETRIDRLLIKISAMNDKVPEEEKAVFIESVLEFAFFTYSVSPRVNTTIRLCRVITRLQKYSDKFSSKSTKHLFKRLVFDDSLFLLKKFRSEDITQVETLFLLLQVAELGKEYRLGIDDLVQYFCLNPNFENIESCHLNYFSIVTLLFYIENRKEYINLFEYLKKVILKRIEKNGHRISWDSELIFLLFDSIACPYFNKSFKRKILRLVGVTSVTAINQIIDLDRNWFTTWRRFDFAKSLDSKKSLEVY